MDPLPPSPDVPLFQSPLQRFPPVSAFMVLALSLLSLGLYVPYWLFTRTRLLTASTPAKNPVAFAMALCMGGYLMLLVLMFRIPATDSIDQLMNLPEFARLMDAAVMVNLLQLAWALLLLQQINRCSGARPGDPLYGSYFVLVLAHLLIVNVFYLQHKINQINRQSGAPPPPTGILQA